jgi:hypothetical protein
MKRVLPFVAALPLVAAALFLTPGEALATDRCGVIGIVNNTRVPLHYSYKIGNGGWQKATIQPGDQTLYWHWYSSGNEDKSPTFLIRFDSDLTSHNFFLEYTLTRYRASEPTWAKAKQYQFSYDGSGRMVDLYSIN